MRWKSHILLGLAIAFLVVAPAIFGSFTITLMNYIGIYAFAALGLVLLTGVGGLTSFGQAAFVGIGAYATAWYTSVHGGSPWIGLLLALVLTGLVATVLGATTLRLGGHFLPLSTIAWGIAIYFLFGNIDALGRYSGLSGIPALTIGPISLAGNTAMYFFIWGLLGIVMLLCRNLLDSRKGRAIRSLRGGIAMVESLEIDFFRMRLAIFVLAGLLAGLSGWLYAHMQRYVSPAPFDLRPGIELLLMALVGGAGHIAGAVVGAAIITLLKNVLQDVLPVFTRYSAQLEIVVFGVLFIVLLQKARAGIVPMISRYLPLPRPTLPEAGAAARTPSTPHRLRPARADNSRRDETVRRISCRQRRELRGQVRRGPGLDRPERSRQDHAPQSDHRDRETERWADPVPRRRHDEIGATPYRRQGRFAHVPARETAPEHDAARQCPARNIFAHAIGVSRGRNPARPRRGSIRKGRGVAAVEARRPR